MWHNVAQGGPMLNPETFPRTPTSQERSKSYSGTNFSKQIFFENMPMNLYIDCYRPFERRVQIAIQGPDFWQYPFDFP